MADKRVKVTRSITVTHSSNLDSYPGMTLEQAAEYERNLAEGDAIEQIVTLIDIEAVTSVTVDVQIVTGE